MTKVSVDKQNKQNQGLVFLLTAVGEGGESTECAPASLHPMYDISAQSFSINPFCTKNYKENFELKGSQ